MKHLLWFLFLITHVTGLYGQEHGEQVRTAKPNVIRWGTASEHGNFGYDVYRSLSENGPFTPLNAEPIPGAGTTDIPQRYEYEDESVLENTVYWYYVEAISLNGDRRRITPIYASKPKPAASADG